MKPVMPRATGMVPSMVTTTPPPQRKRVLGPLDNASMLQPLEPLPQQQQVKVSRTTRPPQEQSFMDVPILEGTREGIRKVGKTLLEWGSSVVPRVPTVRVPLTPVKAATADKAAATAVASTIPPSGNSTFLALAALAAALACLIYTTTSILSTLASAAAAAAVVFLYARRY